jgi:hypothetical protein
MPAEVKPPVAPNARTVAPRGSPRAAVSSRLAKALLDPQRPTVLTIRAPVPVIPRAVLRMGCF